MKGVKGYIYTPTPESDRCVFSCGSRIIRGNLGSSGVVTEKAKHTLKFSGLDHPAWPSPGRPQITRSGSSGLGPDHPGLLRTTEHCLAGSSGPVQKLWLRLIFVGFFSQELHLM